MAGQRWAIAAMACAWRALVGVGVLAGAIGAAPLLAQPITFHMPPSLATGNGPTGIVTADFNQDGRADLATSDAGADAVSVYLGAVGGGFGPAATYPVGDNPVALATARLNGDAFFDLAVVNSASGSVSILLGSASGAFTAAAPVPVGPAPTGIALADVNGGGTDLLVVNTDAETISVRYGDGNGGFSGTASYPTGATPRKIVGVGTDLDTLQDFVVGGFGTVSIHRGAAGGVLGPPVPVPISSNLISRSIAAGQLDADADVDLVVSGRTFGGDAVVEVLLNDGAGGFAAPVQYRVGEDVGDLAVVDLDGNGTRDLVVTAPLDAIATLSGNGDGTFGPPVKYGTGGQSPTGMAVGELDSNAGPDVAVVHFATRTIALLGSLGGGRLDGIPIFPTGFLPLFVAAGDVDVDGDDDVLTLNAEGGSATVSVLRGNRDGTLAPPTAFFVGALPRALVVTDVNADNIPDAVSVTEATGGQGILNVRLSPAGSPPPGGGTHVVGPTPRGLAVADVNGDGVKDALVATASGVALMTGIGNGTFNARAFFAMGSQPQSVASALFDADARPDVVTANAGSNDLTVRLNDGAGGFGPPTHLPTGIAPVVVIATRVDADNAPDIAACYAATSQVIVFRNAGNGTFEAPRSFPIATGARCVSMASLDLNQDGLEDLAVADALNRLLTILRNDGNGGYHPAQHFPVGDISSVAGAHLNGDAKPDLVVATGFNDTVELFLNTTAPPEADLAVTIDDFATEAIPGLSRAYTVVVRNDGPAPVTSVSLGLKLPSIYQSPSYSPRVGSYSPTSGEWTGLALGPNQTATLDLSGTIDPSATGVITVAATVAPVLTVVDPNGSNNTSIDTDTLTPHTDLTVSNTDGVTRVAPLQALTYQVEFTNAGPSDAVDALVADVFPIGVENVTWTCAGTSGATCSAASGNGNFALTEDVPVGGRLTFTASATVAAAASGFLTNVAYVQALIGTTDPNGYNIAHDLDTLEPLAELFHGSRLVRSLAAQGGSARVDHFYLQQRPHSSYEVIVDETSGDIGLTGGPTLERLADLPTIAIQTGVAAGAGPSRALRWINVTGATLPSQLIRVQSASCGTDCGPEDTYRIRAYDTTYSIARFNNAGSQFTVLVLQNRTDRPVHADVYVWRANGMLARTLPLDFAPRQTIVTNLGPVLPGEAGSLTLAQDGGYAALAGKTVALEPSTGFSFDAPMLPRPR